MTRFEELHGRVSGHGDRTLILSHGFGTDQDAWAGIRPWLDTHFRVVSFDLAGCGPDGGGSYDFERHGSIFGYADDLLDIIDELDIDDCIYVGHSVSGMIGGAFSHMLGERRAGVRRQLIQDRFHDLLESVPTGIVLIEGDSRSGLVNERAGALLGVPPGSHPVSDLVAPMRELRAACVNRAELEAVFLALIADVDYAAATIWDLGSRQFEVDTHPIRGEERRSAVSADDRHRSFQDDQRRLRPSGGR